MIIFTIQTRNVTVIMMLGATSLPLVALLISAASSSLQLGYSCSCTSFLDPLPLIERPPGRLTFVSVLAIPFTVISRQNTSQHRAPLIMAARTHPAKFLRYPTTLLSSMPIRPRAHILSPRLMTPHNTGTWCFLMSLTSMDEPSIQEMTRIGRQLI
jgi:hypothetical protein